MFIAFEGPDNVGKSTTAKTLSTFPPIYNATKDTHSAAQLMVGAEKGVVQTYDRIDWFTHMVYRLALPDRDWNDDRPRTVFAMPDTHLVVMLHRPDLANFTAEEVIDTPISRVNPMYYYFADYFMNLNVARNYELFKSVTIVEVVNTVDDYGMRVAMHQSPPLDETSAVARVVCDPESLLEFLQHVEQHIG